jgi:hypothetical protein
MRYTVTIQAFFKVFKNAIQRIADCVLLDGLLT